MAEKAATKVGDNAADEKARKKALHVQPPFPRGSQGAAVG
jgi:hypothetical protein